MIAGILSEINVAEMRARLDALGGNLLVITPNKLPPFPGRPRQLEHFISLVPEDAGEIEKLAPGAKVVPAVARQTTIRAGSRTSRVRLIGTTQDYFEVRNFKVDRGRFFSSDDSGERAIVLGYAVSRDLVPQGVAPGATVLLGSNPYTVIGTLAPQGVNFAGEDEDHQAFVPLTSYQRRIANRLWLSYLYVQLPPNVDSKAIVHNIQAKLRERHGRWDYQVEDALVRNLSDVAVEQSELTSTVVWVVSITGGLLLLVGAIGITTLMMLVVRQRRPEIGLRRALGATPVAIAAQFLIEGVTLSAVGVLMGVVFGMGGSLVAAHAYSVQATWHSSLAVLGIGISLATSTIACVVPAVAAARLEPSVALHS
jgi:putative ABC transport system permease protein